jgi:hypothetical protein
MLVQSTLPSHRYTKRGDRHTEQARDGREAAPHHRRRGKPPADNAGDFAFGGNKARPIRA